MLSPNSPSPPSETANAGLFFISPTMEYYEMEDLNKYSINKYYSQFGEDGIVEEILDRLSKHVTLDNYCSEFGAWDGVHLSNTCYFIKNKGYKAILIEGDKDRVADLERNFPQKDVTKVSCFVSYEGENSLDRIFEKNSMPKNFDFISIDVDGVDYHIFQSMKAYKPKIVCIEFNPNIPNAAEYIQPKNMNIKHGNSARSIIKLANDKGYDLVAVTRCNLIFVRNNIRKFVIDEVPSLAKLNPRGEDATYIFPGYDGTILSNKRRFAIGWHGITVEFSKIQFLPRILRKYYGDYGFIRGLIFIFYVTLFAPDQFKKAAKRFVQKMGYK